MKKLLPLYFFLITINCNVFSQLSSIKNSSSLLLELQKLSHAGSVLYIAAHPDDENTELLAWLANEKKVRTAYLSLTRGDGGQNLIGNEQGEDIGVIRTQELIAARKIDGAEQFFTRAYDFGFTKNPAEVFEFWNKDSVLADVVWVIRLFRPDVIITRFPTTGEGGHGQHTASALLANEAFVAAGDSMRFPSQLKYVHPWKPKRLYTNSLNNNVVNMTGNDQLKIDVGEFNPLLGYSDGELAAMSRSMHRCQGMGTASHDGLHTEYFKLLKGEGNNNDLFSADELSFSRYHGTEKYMELMQEARKNFNAEKPYVIVPVLMHALKALNLMDDTLARNYVKDRLQPLILHCAGYKVEVNADDYAKTRGDECTTTVSFIKRSYSRLRLISINAPEWNLDTILKNNLTENHLYSFKKTFIVSPSQPYSNPFWLNEPVKDNLFTVNDQLKRGMPQITDAFNYNFTFSDGEIAFTVSTPLTYKYTDPIRGEIIRPFEILPAVNVQIEEPVYLFPDTSAKTISVYVSANDSNLSGELVPIVTEGWLVNPTSINFHLVNKEEKQKAVFSVKPRVNSSNNSTTRFSAEAIINGKKYNSTIIHIMYEHIPVQVVVGHCESRLIQLPFKNRAKRIAYIPGAGDKIPSAIKQMNCDVTILTAEDVLNSSKLDYDAVITGIRFFNVDKQSVNVNKVLLDYVKNGGNWICQYNTSNNLLLKDIGPYPFRVSDKRVTDEKSPMYCIAPNSSLLNYPNKITDHDFDGWIQERGLYFCTDVDPHYEMPLNCNDMGEEPMGGSLLYCKYGKGNFIYTNLSFFRQLPAGVPGAYRLFANLISAGK